MCLTIRIHVLLVLFHVDWLMVSTPLKNMKVNLDSYSQLIWENQPVMFQSPPNITIENYHYQILLVGKSTINGYQSPTSKYVSASNRFGRTVFWLEESRAEVSTTKRCSLVHARKSMTQCLVDPMGLSMVYLWLVYGQYMDTLWIIYG